MKGRQLKPAMLCATVILACTSGAMADGLSAYQIAMSDASHAFDIQMSKTGTSKSTYALNLTSRGTITREDQDGARHTIHPELVAVYDKTSGQCVWGFDSDAFPVLPRKAALAVRSAAAGWPDEATNAVVADPETCWKRSYLATILGDVERVFAANFPDRVVYLGFPTSVEGS